MLAHSNLAKEFRGGERQTCLLLQALAERGWQQRLIARHGSELVEHAASIPGLDIVCVGTNPVAYARATRGCALTQAHGARDVYVALAGKWACNVPMVVTRRVMRPQKKSWIRDKAFYGAEAVVAVSNAVAKHVQETYPEISPIVIPDAHADLPLDAAESSAIRARFKGKTLIGHVGTYDHRAKGQLTIIEAARRAAQEHPEWHFLLMGAGRQESLFRERIGTLQNIELAGFVTNVGDYLAACDVFVFPSLTEALGSSLLDAMQFGLPIVATRVGGIPEVVEDGVNGILIDPEAADQLFAGIERLAKRSPEVDAMHLANRARAASYSATRMADAYERLYRSILP